MKIEIKGASLFALVIASLMVILLLAPPKVAGFSGSESGTARDPYVITTVEQLQAMEDNLTAHYALGNDINASGTISWNSGAGFLPIGTSSTPFTGSFNGQGYKIDNLYINRSGTGYQGLFGYVGTGGVVENVGLENENVTGGDSVGGLVACNTGAVSNSYSSDSVTGGDHAGGLVGVNTGTVSNCYSTGSVSGGESVGGLVGWNNGTISNCYSTGSVSGGYPVGGLVGINYSNGTITNSYSTGPASGGSEVGGLVGSNTYGTITNSYSTGSVSGGDFVGGLVGHNEGTVSDCYSTGSASGNYVGGLIGFNNGGTVSNCYSTGPASGSWEGGLVGANQGYVSNSFWDTQTSGQETSADGTGKTTENMKNVRTYTDVAWGEGLSSAWDFVGNPYGDAGNADIWGIDPDVNGGYPFLAQPAAPVEGTTAPSGGSNLPIIVGVVVVIVVIGVVATVYVRRR